LDSIIVGLGGLDKIDLNELVSRLASSSKNVGCVIVFIGIVREEGALGGRVKHLEYEAYESMAVKEMEKLIRKVVDQNRVFSACIYHEVGCIGVGERTMIVGVAAKHRADGFSALKKLVDMVKSRVPIWKKEVTDRGSYWLHEVEGKRKQ